MEKYNEVRHVGCCPNPNHDDNNPSCSYNPKTYSFHCFSCNYSIDVLEAYMTRKNLTFTEACEKLFEEAGIAYDFTERGTKSNQYKYPKPEYAEDKRVVYDYWKLRKISKETVDYLDIQQDKSGNTLFQYKDSNDVLVMVKVRKSAPVRKGENKCWCLPGADTQQILYNINKINVTQPLIITSGEGDCATAIECGFSNAVSICLGDGNTQWIGTCWDFLQQFDSIILIHDNDASGEKFARDVSTRLGEYRVKIADIPKSYEAEDGTKYRIKDLNELLYRSGVNTVRDVINNAKDSEIPSIVDYTDVKRFDMSDVDGFTTRFDALDYAIDKFYVGTTTVLTGITGSGKSSFISTLVCQSVEQGYPCFIYSGELSNPSLKNWIDTVNAGQRNLEEYVMGNNKHYKINPAAFDKINKFYKGQMFFYKDGFDHKISRLMNTMESVVRKYGVKTLILDNMSSVDLENDDNNKYIKQDEFIRAVIEFSKKWQVICIVVLHPKKMEAVRRMSIFDLQGCVSAVNLAHRVISLYRVQPRDKEGVINRNGTVLVPPITHDVLVDILKDRFGSGANKSIGLYYDVPSRRFFDSYESLDFQYAWDKNEYEAALPYGAPQLEVEKEIFGEVR